MKMFTAVFIGADNSTVYLCMVNSVQRDPLRTGNEYIPSKLQKIPYIFVIHYSKPEIT